MLPPALPSVADTRSGEADSWLSYFFSWGVAEPVCVLCLTHASMLCPTHLPRDQVFRTLGFLTVAEFSSTMHRAMAYLAREMCRLSGVPLSGDSMLRILCRSKLIYQWLLLRAIQGEAKGLNMLASSFRASSQVELITYLDVLKKHKMQQNKTAVTGHLSPLHQFLNNHSKT